MSFKKGKAVKNNIWIKTDTANETGKELIITLIYLKQ
jgi:hypothetical protein